MDVAVGDVIERVKRGPQHQRERGEIDARMRGARRRREDERRKVRIQ
ncbi:hypothetical protein [Vulcanimicrobium alpinum]|nr:hypothetical protein [Vulcanimicrobium alpinum]